MLKPWFGFHSDNSKFQGPLITLCHLRWEPKSILKDMMCSLEKQSREPGFVCAAQEVKLVMSHHFPIILELGPAEQKELLSIKWAL